MLDLNILKETRANKATSGKKDTNYSNCLNQGLRLLKKAVSRINPDKVELRKAADCFADCLKIRKTAAEPYLYLSMIFIMLGNKAMAAKYYEIAVMLKPDAEELPVIRKKIF